jgi:VanZ family protein
MEVNPPMFDKRQRLCFFLALTLLWMGVIYWKSSQSYSQQDLKPWLASLISEQTLLALLPKLEFTYDGDLVTYLKPFGFLEFFLRKGAHITEYFILAFLLWQTLASTRLARPWVFLLAALLSVLYAASDEWHQSYVPNRTGHPIDVGMDSVGVVLAMLACLLWQLRPRKKKLSRHA